MSFRKSVIKGISWMGALKLTTRALTFVRIGILARLLTPVQFGVFGVATMALALLETLTDTGINVFFIQKEGKLRDFLDTAFLVSIGRGFLIGLLLFVTALPVANFFHAPEAKLALMLIALCAVIRGFINPAIITYQQKLQFNKEFWLRFSLFAVDALVSITLALITKNAVSMVFGMIASAILEVVISFTLIKPRPKLIFNNLKVGKVLNRGKWVTLAGVFQYFFANGDNIAVGRILDTISLGYYQMAYRISTVPITEVTDVFSKVTFPVYSTIAQNKKRLLRAFVKTTGVISALVVPLGFVIYFFPVEIVKILLGDTWLPIIEVLKVLAIFGIIRSISSVAPPLFLAVKKQEYVTYLTLASFLGLAFSIIPLISKFGIVGAAYAALIGAIFSVPVIVICLWKVFKEDR